MQRRLKRSYTAGNTSTMINSSRPKLRRMINHIDDDTDSATTKGQRQHTRDNPLAPPPSSSTSTMMMIPTLRLTPPLPSPIRSTTAAPIVAAGSEDARNTQDDHSDTDQDNDDNDHSGDGNGDDSGANEVSPIQNFTNTFTCVKIEGQLVSHWYVQNSWTDRFIPRG